MGRKQSRLRMGLRGRTGFLAYTLFGSAVLIAIYYAWGSLFPSSSAKITYSSVQGVKSVHLAQWQKQKEKGFVNGEIEMLVQQSNEKFQKARALQDHIDEDRILEEHAAEKDFQSDDNPDAELGDTDDIFSKLERLVHLDLKGAPPLVSYLEKLFPVLKRLGATGLLIEYEDMFPYSGNISILAAKNAYTFSDLRRLQEAAKLNGLEIIPLVQTFGHMEFVLKYQAFKDLRESDYTPQVITPARQESYTLLFNILEQVLRAHPESRRIHLGCDEVYELGKGQSSSMGQNRSQLFLHHVAQIAGYVKNTFRQIQPLIWDDWLRNIPYDVLAESGLQSLVQPVVWYYQHNILQRIPESVWTTYGKLFPAVWVASAFKGATGSAQIVTNASFHLDNNLQWLKVIDRFGVQQQVVQFQGMILTGWQRYDHFATLCELLPVGLPSLALSLQAVVTSSRDTMLLSAASHLLNCSHQLDLHFPPVGGTQDCVFPGSDVYYSVQQLWGILEVYRRDRGLQERIQGWMTDYQLRQGLSSPGQMQIVVHKLSKMLAMLKLLNRSLRIYLQHVYDGSTVDEWMTTNVQDQTSHLQDLLAKAKKLLERKEWPARPFPQVTSLELASAQFPKPGLGLAQLPRAEAVEHWQNNALPAGPILQPAGGSLKPAVDVPENLRRVVQDGAVRTLEQTQSNQKMSNQLEGGLSNVLLFRRKSGQGRPSGPDKFQYKVELKESRAGFLTRDSSQWQQHFSNPNHNPKSLHQQPAHNLFPKMEGQRPNVQRLLDGRNQLLAHSSQRGQGNQIFNSDSQQPGTLQKDVLNQQPAAVNDENKPGDAESALARQPWAVYNENKPGDAEPALARQPGAVYNENKPGDAEPALVRQPGAIYNENKPGDAEPALVRQPGAVYNENKPGDAEPALAKQPGAVYNENKPGDAEPALARQPGAVYNENKPGDAEAALARQPGAVYNENKPGDAEPALARQPGAVYNENKPGDSEAALARQPGAVYNENKPGDAEAALARQSADVSRVHVEGENADGEKLLTESNDNQMNKISRK